MGLNALSLTQPWADLVVLGAKKIETRSWGTTYRGPLAIQSAKRWTGNDRRLVGMFPFNEALGPRAVDSFALGAIVGVVELVDVLVMANGPAGDPLLRLSLESVGEPERSFGGYAPGRYAWVLRAPRRLERPVPCVGRLGIFGLTPVVEAAVRAGLEASSRSSTTRQEVRDGGGLAEREPNDNSKGSRLLNSFPGGAGPVSPAPPLPTEEPFALEIEERAAILEFEAGLERAEATRRARAMWGLQT